MERRGDQTLLGRMAARGRPADPAPVTPTRAVRLAFTRAAERVARLPLTVLGVGQEEVEADALLQRAEGDHLLLRMDTDAGPGAAAVDRECLSAIIEMQLRGRLSPQPAEVRPLTAADAALAEPLVAAFLADLAMAAAGTALDGWGADARPAGRIADARALGLLLGEARFRLVALTLDLGAGERQGLFLLALPVPPLPQAEETPAERAALWSAALSQGVMAAPAAVDAVLHRMRLPLAAVQALQPGQCLTLPGVRVSSVRIEGAEGRLIARGRLGQIGGMRAVRVEAEVPPELADGLPRPAVSPGPVGCLTRDPG